MFHVLLIILFYIDFSITNNPILIASPYPFNTSESSHIECFSNDQGILSSLTIIAKMLDINQNIPSLQHSEDNITKNKSISLTIPSPFNYSQLHPKIECRSKSPLGVQTTSQLDVLSVVEIPQTEFLTLNTYTKQMITINCLTYGTDVFILWEFSKDISKDIFSSLPLGVRIHEQFILNDTLIINYVSYSDHHGYYRCSGTNKLLGITYEDQSIIYLNVQKSSIWIPILIVCVIIGICILLLILCAKYCQKKRKNQLEIKENEEQIVPNRESIAFSPYYNRQRSSERIVENIGESKLQQESVYTRSHSENNTKSEISILSTEKEQDHIPFFSKTSPQFALGNPFLDPNVQPYSSMKQYIDKLK